MLNGINVAGLSEYRHEVETSPEEARAAYGVALDWQTGTRSKARTLPMTLGSRRLSRDFSWTIDEPRPLLGLDHGPNPQELLLSGIGGCLLVAYSMGAAVMGIRLETLTIEVQGELDLRGFLDLDADAPVGFAEIRYRVEVRADGSPEDLERLHRKVMEQSPNRMTVARGARVEGELVVLDAAAVAA